MEWTDSFKKNINDTVTVIDKLFKEYKIDNSIIVLDFTFFFPEKEGSENWNIHIYQYAPIEYTTLLNQLYQASDNKFAKFESKTKVFRDLNDQPTTTSELSFQNPQEFIGEVLNRTNFTPESWHKDLINNKFGGASIVVSKEYDKGSYPIQAGVYLILAKKFGCFESDTTPNNITLIGKRNQNKNENENENETKTKTVTQIWAILEDLLFDEMFELVVDKFKQIELEKEEINIKRNQQRTINHYLRPIFTGISLKAKDIQEQIEADKKTDAIRSSKTLQLQSAILEHHFQLGQRLEDLSNSNAGEKIKIGFELFFKYLYVRNFFTGSNIDDQVVSTLSSEEFNLIKILCTTSFHDFWNTQQNELEKQINSLFSKMTIESPFKLLFRGLTSDMYILLPNSYAAMDIVVKFSSTFIQNFKSHWMKDVFTRKDGTKLNSSLIIYGNKNEIYFFQYKENQGYVNYPINLSEKYITEEYSAFITKYKEGFIEYQSTTGLGNNDLKTLLKLNNTECSYYKKDIEFQIIINGNPAPRLEEGYLFFVKITINDNSTILKFD